MLSLLYFSTIDGCIITPSNGNTHRFTHIFRQRACAGHTASTHARVDRGPTGTDQLPLPHHRFLTLPATMLCCGGGDGVDVDPAMKKLDEQVCVHGTAAALCSLWLLSPRAPLCSPGGVLALGTVHALCPKLLARAVAMRWMVGLEGALLPLA